MFEFFFLFVYSLIRCDFAVILPNKFHNCFEALIGTLNSVFHHVCPFSNCPCAMPLSCFTLSLVSVFQSPFLPWFSSSNLWPSLSSYPFSYQTPSSTKMIHDISYPFSYALRDIYVCSLQLSVYRKLKRAWTLSCMQEYSKVHGYCQTSSIAKSLKLLPSLNKGVTISSTATSALHRFHQSPLHEHQPSCHLHHIRLRTTLFNSSWSCPVVPGNSIFISSSTHTIKQSLFRIFRVYTIKVVSEIFSIRHKLHCQLFGTTKLV